MKASTLAGRLTVAPQPGGSHVDFFLRNYFAETLLLKRINCTLPEGTLVEDVRVGRNSQMAASGSFKASILAHLPTLRFDHVPPQMNICLSLDIPSADGYDDRIEFEVTTKEPGSRHLLYPAGTKTQIAGRLVELAATPQLFKAFEAGEVAIEVKQRPGVPDYQEAPEIVCKVVAKSGRLKLADPIEFAVGSNFTVAFSGERANEFKAVDIVGILELDVTRF